MPRSLLLSPFFRACGENTTRIASYRTSRGKIVFMQDRTLDHAKENPARGRGF
jgi:hypothetical protein